MKFVRCIQEYAVQAYVTGQDFYELGSYDSVRILRERIDTQHFGAVRAHHGRIDSVTCSCNAIRHGIFERLLLCSKELMAAMT